MSGILLRYLAYFGPGREPAAIEFGPSLNVICGASDTGKSLILESIDFMLGRTDPVPDIPERSGYDRIRLIVESAGHSTLTLDRSVEGGHFSAYDGMLFYDIENSAPSTLRCKHAATRTDTLSYQLLTRIGFTANKILRKNKSGTTRTLSFRDIARLCIVSDEGIERRGSPVLSGNPTSSTSEYSAFKLMLTGNDDSALVSMNNDSARHEHNGGKLELLDQLIDELQTELEEAGEDEDDLKEQMQRLEASLEKSKLSILEAQQKFNLVMEERASAATQLRETKARLLELKEYIERFSLLERHYMSDLERLRAIYESGTLFVYLEAKPCPLCGALPGDQHLDGECEGNTEAVIQAAAAEIKKIEILRSELAATLASLREKYFILDKSFPRLQASYDSVESQLHSIVAPAVFEERASYDVLMSEQATVRSSLEKINRLHKLIQRRVDLESDCEKQNCATNESKTIIPKNILDDFATEIQQLLEEWDYPDASRVFFDESQKDIQISGKPRGSSGRGLRAITHAAFTIGLMQFCRKRSLPHPGFVVLDSPLLAYWKPEGEADDLRGTNLKDKFYRYLLGMSGDYQIIIIENEHPPSFVEHSASVTVFTKNPNDGRFGFFPPKVVPVLRTSER
ncbi:AAA family ATPase [Megalodesulfovibrio paquesii]